jgi:MYXO-CTERM domain-containing protein
VIKVDIDNGTGDPTCLDGTTLDPPTGPIKCVGGGDAGAPTADAGVDSGADAGHAAEAASGVQDTGLVEIPVDSGTSPSGPTPALHPRGDVSDVEGGCSCRMADGNRSTQSDAWLGAALVAWALGRRRWGRASSSIG